MGIDTDLYDIDDWYDGKYDSHLEVIEKFLEGSGLSIEDIEELKRKNDPDHKIIRWKIGNNHYLEGSREIEIDDIIIKPTVNEDDSKNVSKKINSLREKSELPENNIEVKII